MEEFDKFIPEKNKDEFKNKLEEPRCDICGGAHKTSNHSESLLGKTELLNPVCEICKGGHKTSRHDEFELDKKSKLNPIEDKYKEEKINKLEEQCCDICGGMHKTSHHEEVTGLKGRGESKDK